MQRLWLIGSVLFLLIACQTLAQVPTEDATPVEIVLATQGSLGQTLTPSKTNTPFPAKSFTPWASPTRVETDTAPNTTALPAQSVFNVRLHPDGPLFVGDLVSLEVIPPEDIKFEGGSVQVYADLAQELKIGETHFSPFGIGGRVQATFYWNWDTSQLAAGEHTLTFSVQPQDINWTETVTLLPHSQAPPPEPDAVWASEESDCCLVHYITGTAAERDLSDLLDLVDFQVEHANHLIGAHLNETLEIVFLPRVLGHGGFVNNGIFVSYLDRNYAGDGAQTVLHHEIVHALDNSVGGELRPTLLLEGLAVYLSGGHFKPESLVERAAALLPPEEGCISVDWQSYDTSTTGEACGLDWYIPFEKLAKNFYFEQHEIGYLQAGSLVTFMVETWGWPAFSAFYRDIHPPSDTAELETEGNNPQYKALDVALDVHFEITFSELERQYLEYLYTQKLTRKSVADVRLSVQFYETVRRYQDNLDPSAYFLTAWLPNSQQMRNRGIVADYLRRPSLVENLAIETMLISADAHLRAGEYSEAERLLTAVNSVLDEYPESGLQAFVVDEVAVDYFSLVKAVLDAGYQPQKIHLNHESAQVRANKSGSEITVLDLFRASDGWKVSLKVGQ